MKKQAYEKLMGLHKQAEVNYGPQPNTIKSTLEGIADWLPLNTASRFVKSTVNPVGTAVDDIKSAYNWSTTKTPSKPKGGAPMDKPTWKERLKARIFDPQEYVRQNMYYNPKREQQILSKYDPHPSSTSGVNASKELSLRDRLKSAIRKGNTQNPAADLTMLQLGSQFGSANSGLHKIVNSPAAAYVDTMRVKRKGELAAKMLAIRNSKKNKPGMWDIMFNRWKWDE